MSLVGVAMVVLALALLAAWIAPAWALRRFVPALESSGRTSHNFHGRSVVLGLGAVWLVWTVTVRLASLLLEVWARSTPGSTAAMAIRSVALVALDAVPSLLVLAAFAFGLLDDAFGTSAEKGYRGHLRALREGRLTTGAMKLFGVGAAAMVAGAEAVSSSSAVDAAGPGFSLTFMAAWALATLAIGLSANLLNLLDLRPGRALKSYLVLVVPLVTVSALATLSGPASVSAVCFDAPARILAVLAAIITFAGPALAAWRFDLGERGMLGDAGSNAMGAIIGYLLATVLPLWWLAVAVAVLLAANLLSEKVSFSRIIEGNAVLRWADGLGRLPDGPGEADGPNGFGRLPDGSSRSDALPDGSPGSGAAVSPDTEEE